MYTTLSLSRLSADEDRRGLLHVTWTVTGQPEASKRPLLRRLPKVGIPPQQSSSAVIRHLHSLQRFTPPSHFGLSRRDNACARGRANAVLEAAG